ncbi:MAG: hypothetical protein SOT34_02570 [Candidatus Borkfalkiaceae bacterium]|nr:hypothetical protein [Christensenellaceae bacterium]
MKRKWMKRLFALIAASCMCCFLSCGTPGTETGISPGGESVQEGEGNNELLYGFAEPFAGTNVSGFNPRVEAYLAGVIGAKTFRLWMNDSNLFGAKYTEVIDNAELAEVPRSATLMYETYIEELRSAGIREITCMGMLFPRTASTANGLEGSFVPRRDEETGSEYMQFLEKVEILWESVAGAFPGIDVWEMGNETNQAAFLKYADGDPTTEELAAINVDYMYYALKGIRKGNSSAVCITPGYAPVGGIGTVREFLTDVYDAIGSGNFPAGQTKCTDPDEYFDGVAWHPYDGGSGIVLTKAPDIVQWVRENDEVRQIMISRGDEEKEVWFTEFGFTFDMYSLPVAGEGEEDITSYTINGVTYRLDDETEEKQAEWIRLYFDAMKGMEYVHTCHFFRLCCAKKDAQWGGVGEIFFGCFLEPDSALGRGFYPRKKAYVLQEIYGGTGDLNAYARG